MVGKRVGDLVRAGVGEAEILSIRESGVIQAYIQEPTSARYPASAQHSA